MANFLLPPPPVLEPFTIDGKRFTSTWQKWYNDLRAVIPESYVSKQSITAAGALDQSAHYIALTTTSAGYAVTLDVPTIPGITKVIEMIADGGFDVTMSLANCTSGSASTTCTWNSIGDTLTLISKSNKWIIIDEDGVVLS